MMFFSAFKLWRVIAELLHGGGTGFWDEVLGMAYTILFLVILIDLVFLKVARTNLPAPKINHQLG
jgi:hypothetical protein